MNTMSPALKVNIPSVDVINQISDISMATATNNRRMLILIRLRLERTTMIRWIKQ